MAKIKTFIKENRGFFLFLGLMIIVRSAVADWNDVPTGSMQPTIQIGDRIYVDKLAYDVRVPLTLTSLHKIADPQQGDIIVFESEVSDNRLVKRVIGVPGDKVAMVDNRVYLNGKPLAYRQIQQDENGNIDMWEELNGKPHRIRINQNGAYLPGFKEVTVPLNSYLVLGDNRDNSADSRVIGFVPRHEIIGKSESVVLSLNYDNYFLPRSERFFQALDDAT